MSWNKNDYRKQREEMEAPPPTPERTPRRQLAIAYSEDGLLGDDTSHHQVPIKVRKMYEEAGLIDPRTWDAYREMMTRGIEAL